MREFRVRTDTLLPQLPKVHLFRYLSEEARRRLLSCATFEEYDEGEWFIHEHEVESRFYVILSGTCSVMVNRDGRDSYVAALGVGQVVGEAAIFANRPRTAGVVAQTTSRVMCFERDCFLRVLRDEPQAGLRILYVLVHDLLGKLREVNLELAFERRDNAGQDDIDALIENLMAGGDEE